MGLNIDDEGDVLAESNAPLRSPFSESHSCRGATTGCTRVARRGGNHAARVVTNIANGGTPTRLRVAHKSTVSGIFPSIGGWFPILRFTLWSPGIETGSPTNLVAGK